MDFLYKIACNGKHQCLFTLNEHLTRVRYTIILLSALPFTIHIQVDFLHKFRLSVVSTYSNDILF